jgi:hypothetical protein
MYINDLIEELNRLNCGIQVGNRNVSALAFADDIAIISRNENDLQRMFDTVSNWCKKWRLSINPLKSQVLHFRFKGKLQSNFKFKCGEYDIGYAAQYKYLGMWLNENLDYEYTVKQLSN